MKDKGLHTPHRADRNSVLRFHLTKIELSPYTTVDSVIFWSRNEERGKIVIVEGRGCGSVEGKKFAVCREVGGY